MKRENRICQSCGMPLKKDPNSGGTEADEKKKKKYCSYCYQDGKFTMDCTAKEMQDYCYNMMITKMKMPKLLAKLFTISIPKLERWK